MNILIHASLIILKLRKSRYTKEIKPANNFLFGSIPIVRKYE